jgi:hypothetical protein
MIHVFLCFLPLLMGAYRKGWGVTFIVLGAGSFILPMMGVQFRLISLFGEAAPVVGVVLLALGVLMVVMGPKSEEGQ